MQANLHSNLFILIPLQHLAIPNHVNNLHSNLFILIRNDLKNYKHTEEIYILIYLY